MVLKKAHFICLPLQLFSLAKRAIQRCCSLECSSMQSTIHQKSSNHLYKIEAQVTSSGIFCFIFWSWWRSGLHFSMSSDLLTIFFSSYSCFYLGDWMHVYSFCYSTLLTAMNLAVSACIFSLLLIGYCWKSCSWTNTVVEDRLLLLLFMMDMFFKRYPSTKSNCLSVFPFLSWWL